MQWIFVDLVFCNYFVGIRIWGMRGFSGWEEEKINNPANLRNGEKINQDSWLLLLSLFFTLKTVIIST